ncbi:hypothetical protein AURDEDRAFT_175073 [Auricularia subglabra TFB-10046 SS5]|nr:hypothetical protein AURDEDRAFT_175073 [Auricularia subglabra TFB-10046 SS5]
MDDGDRDTHYQEPGVMAGRAFSLSSNAKSHYEVLGVREDAEDDEITEAFKSLVRQLHSTNITCPKTGLDLKGTFIPTR